MILQKNKGFINPTVHGPKFNRRPDSPGKAAYFRPGEKIGAWPGHRGPTARLAWPNTGWAGLIALPGQDA
jgi:hypothetical protein